MILTILGMFLWVRLVIDNLRSQTTARELENSLEKLPEGLEEAWVDKAVPSLLALPLLTILF